VLKFLFIHLKITLRYAVFFFFILNQFQSYCQSDKVTNWKLSKDKNGIQVFTRSIEGTKFKEYKTLSEVDATPEELLAILVDVESYNKWMAYVNVAEILKTEGENRFYVYSEVAVPWPFSNRDEITLSVIKRHEESSEITIEITIIQEDNIPEKKGIVRMPSGSGVWEFTPTETGKTKIYHRFGADPGGNIPAWIVNLFLVDGPYKTMLGLQEQAAKLSFKK
jgi:hypothetical protein